MKENPECKGRRCHGLEGPHVAEVSRGQNFPLAGHNKYMKYMIQYLH